MDCSSYCSCCVWPSTVAIDGGRCFVISPGVIPVHVVKWLFFTALIHVDGTGECNISKTILFFPPDFNVFDNTHKNALLYEYLRLNMM